MLSKRRLFPLLFAIVTLEAGVYLWGLDYAKQGIVSGDGHQYVAIARNLSKGLISIDGVNPTLLRTPGYPLFISLGAGNLLLLLRIEQFALHFLTACILFELVGLYFHRNVATIAAVLSATYFVMSWLAVTQLSETLTIFLLVAALYMLTKQRMVTTGVLFAALCWVRPEFVLLPFACVLFLFIERKIIVMLAVFAICLTPLAVRNIIVAHRFVPMGLGSGMALYASAQQYSGEISYKFTVPEFERFRADYQRRVDSAGGDGIQNELAVEDSYKADARKLFRSVPLGQYLRSLPMRLRYLWGTADATSGWHHRLVQIQWPLWFGSAIVGIWISRKQLIRLWPFWIVAAYLTTLHLVFHVDGRYTVPARPLLFAFSGVTIASAIVIARKTISSSAA